MPQVFLTLIYLIKNQFSFGKERKAAKANLRFDRFDITWITFLKKYKYYYVDIYTFYKENIGEEKAMFKAQLAYNRH